MRKKEGFSMKCISCKRKIPDKSLFCPRCGTRQNSDSSEFDNGYSYVPEESAYSFDSGTDNYGSYDYSGDSAGYDFDAGFSIPPQKKKSPLPLIALCAGVAAVSTLVVVMVLSMLGVIGGNSKRPDADPVNPGILQTQPGKKDDEVKPSPENDSDNQITDLSNIVDCISCGGSGNCVACKGEKHCPYCGGTGVEPCYSCWGSNKCSNCNNGVTTRGEKCKGCNGKGTCTFDVCTDGYEPCWKCNGQKPCYLCNGDGECLTCGGKGSYDINCYPQQTLTAYRAVEHDDCWYGKTVCDSTWCNEGKCSYNDCNGTGKLACTVCGGLNQCSVCTNNSRYDNRKCSACDDTGECSQCDNGYTLCYMCEGTGNCASCMGVYEKDCYYCLDGYQYEDYRYTIGRSTPEPDPNPDPDPTAASRPTGSNVVDCSACGGDGWWCNTCNGSGYCPAPGCMDGELICPQCSGAKSCNACWTQTDRSKRCSSCGYSRDCQTCDGNGTVECTRCNGNGDCPTCEGDYWCDACDGYGFIIKD